MKIAGIVFAGWIGSAIGAFWYFEGRYQIPAKPLGPVASGEAIVPVSIGKPTLLNFWNPDCPCSDYMRPHVEGLIKQLGSKVDFVTVVACPEKDRARVQKAFFQAGISSRLRIDVGGKLATKYGVAAAPAGVLLSPEGRVLFAGTYNVGRFCQDEKTAFVKLALQSTLAGEPIKIRTTPFYGCSTYTETGR